MVATKPLPRTRAEGAMQLAQSLDRMSFPAHPETPGIPITTIGVDQCRYIITITYSRLFVVALVHLARAVGVTNMLGLSSPLRVWLSRVSGGGRQAKAPCLNQQVKGEEARRAP